MNNISFPRYISVQMDKIQNFHTKFWLGSPINFAQQLIFRLVRFQQDDVVLFVGLGSLLNPIFGEDKITIGRLWKLFLRKAK